MEEILVITPPNRLSELRQGFTPAHPVYRLGQGGRLMRMGQNNLRGGAMVLDVGGLDGRGEMPGLCRQIVSECTTRNFRGVICMGKQSVPRQLAAQLDEVLARRRIDLYVPERWGQHTRTARVLIGSALSGGSLTCRLQEAAEQFGGVQRVALWIERSAEDFLLPAWSGCGRPLTGPELSALMERLKPSVFFSDELCARYFTYMTAEGGAHFVLFDDGATIRKKLQVARQLGIDRAAARFEQVEDLME
ncbi:MAG: hypothetical protein IJB75_08285 [Oscillospiraceae bacterium]|nr:hypothetical protein [Oscillospiraceae bacterium]